MCFSNEVKRINLSGKSVEKSNINYEIHGVILESFHLKTI